MTINVDYPHNAMVPMTHMPGQVNNVNATWQVWPHEYFPPNYPTYVQTIQTCCCHQSFCWKCFMDSLEKAKMLQTITAPPTESLADKLTAQARTRMSEIQKRLDEVPALKEELDRLRRMVDAGSP